MHPAEKDVFRLEKGTQLCYDQYTIVQVCDIQTAVGSVCPVHVQFCDEISYVANGVCTHVINGNQYNMKAGDLLLLHKEDVHSYTTDPNDPARIFNIGIIEANGKRLDSEQNRFYPWYLSANPIQLHEMHDVGELFIHIFEEMTANYPEWKRAVHLYVEQMSIKIFRSFQHILSKPYTMDDKIQVNNCLLYAMIHYLDVHYEQMDILQKMPEVLHYSYTHLSHLFKKEMGVSLANYYKQRRFYQAAELLSHGSESITEVSEKMGYQTVHAFSKAFKKYYGISPTEYIRIKTETQLV